MGCLRRLKSWKGSVSCNKRAPLQHESLWKYCETHCLSMIPGVKRGSLTEGICVRVPVIVSGARTPIGAFGGSLRPLTAAELGAIAIKAALERARVAPEEVDEVVMGMVYQAGARANPARQAALGAGIRVEAGASTINQQCSSGSRAVDIAADQIRLGKADIVVAGGMESMSRVPHLLLRARWGERLGGETLEDGLLYDALIDPFYNGHMALSAETLAVRYGISRADADAFALESQQRAAAAHQAGLFEEEIVAVQVADGKSVQVVAQDEHPKPWTTFEKLSKLPPVFKEGGICTAGNSSGLNDGATALVIMAEEVAHARGLEPLAKLAYAVTVAVPPEVMGFGPVPAVRKLLAVNGLSLGDIDLFEINEAFAVQVLACARELDLDGDKLNVNGGAIALGHPVGATGARLILTLALELRRRGLRRGIATQCAGGGPAMATLVEVE